MTATHVETETQREHDQRSYFNGQPVSIENTAYMRQTMRRLQNGTLPFHETPDRACSEARHKVFRRMMLLPDYTRDAQWWQERDSQMADCVRTSR